jgi:hypothetical protein
MRVAFYLDRFSKNVHLSNVMKIRSVGAELYADGRTHTHIHTDGRTDRHDKASSRFLQFCEPS